MQPRLSILSGATEGAQSKEAALLTRSGVLRLRSGEQMARNSAQDAAICGSRASSAALPMVAPLRMLDPSAAGSWMLASWMLGLSHVGWRRRRAGTLRCGGPAPMYSAAMLNQPTRALRRCIVADARGDTRQPLLVMACASAPLTANSNCSGRYAGLQTRSELQRTRLRLPRPRRRLRLRRPGVRHDPDDGLPTIAQARLPREARETIRLIAARAARSPTTGTARTFQNREGLLPKRASGYYREYTVVTPGSSDRGARRIVAGRGGELYYTDDHYDSFKRVTQ